MGSPELRTLLSTINCLSEFVVHVFNAAIVNRNTDCADCLGLSIQSQEERGFTNNVWYCAIKANKNKMVF